MKSSMLSILGGVVVTAAGVAEVDEGDDADKEGLVEIVVISMEDVFDGRGEDRLIDGDGVASGMLATEVIIEPF